MKILANNSIPFERFIGFKFNIAFFNLIFDLRSNKSAKRDLRREITEDTFMNSLQISIGPEKNLIHETQGINFKMSSQTKFKNWEDLCTSFRPWLESHYCGLGT